MVRHKHKSLFEGDNKVLFNNIMMSAIVAVIASLLTIGIMVAVIPYSLLGPTPGGNGNINVAGSNQIADDDGPNIINANACSADGVCEVNNLNSAGNVFTNSLSVKHPSGIPQQGSGEADIDFLEVNEAFAVGENFGPRVLITPGNVNISGQLTLSGSLHTFSDVNIRDDLWIQNEATGVNVGNLGSDDSNDRVILSGNTQGGLWLWATNPLGNVSLVAGGFPSLTVDSQENIILGRNYDGNGNAYACITPTGLLYRSVTPCT